MITSKEVYKRYLLKLNKNDSNEGVNILPSHFVLMFNTEAGRWLTEFFNDDSDNWKLSTIDNLLEVDKLLTKVKKYDDNIEFQLPVDFFRHASSFVVADKGNCKGNKVFAFEKKALGFNTNIADDFSSPQFDYRETPFQITKSKMKIYFDDFDIKRAYTSYYKYPTPLDIAGYEKFDGSPSSDVNTDLTIDQIDAILDRLVAETSGQTKDAERYQFVKDRISTEP